MNFDRRKETEARRVPPVKDDMLDLLAERILMDMIRQEAPVDDFHFIIDTGWNVPRGER